MNKIIEIEHLFASYDHKPVLRDVNLNVYERDFLGIIGPNGGGKEPSPSQLKELMLTCKKEGVRVIFVQEEFDKSNAELIAKETGTKIVRINPLSYDWKND